MKRACVYLVFVCVLLAILPFSETSAASVTKLSENGKKFIQSCEGFFDVAYQDQAGVWTIGWGHTGGVKRGMKITKEQAQDYFSQDMAKFENEVVSYGTRLGVSFSQQQFDALVSLTFNVGTDPFSSDRRLTRAIRKYGSSSGVNIPTDKVWECFATYHHHNKIIDNEGLFYRRMNEARIFALGDYTRSLNWKNPSWLLPGQQGREVPDGWVPEEYGGSLVIPNDTDPTVDFRVPLKAYTDTEGNVTTYVDSSGNAVSGYIEGKTDLCVINKVYENGRVEVEYPTPKGNKIAYAYLSDFINSSYAVSSYSYSVPSNTPVFRRRDLGESMGTVYPTDNIIVVGETDGCLQIIYPISEGFKLGWINGATGGSGLYPSQLTIDTRYPTPLKVYTNASGNVSTYSAINGGSSGAIFTGDLCVIQEVYTNGWCKVNYPTSSYYKTAYTQFSNFLDTGCQITPTSYRPSQTLAVYRRKDLSESMGSIWTSDNCIMVARSGAVCQLIYPLDAGGYKMGWAGLSTDVPTLDWPMPLKCFINSSTDKANVYEGIDNNPGYGKIFVDDECTINTVYKNGWVNVTYPISGGTKTGYVPLSVFVPNSISTYGDTASKKILSYRKPDMETNYGWADPGDSLVIVGKSGGKVQMIYPVSGGYKLAWAYESDFTRTLSSISITANPRTLTYMEGQDIDYTGMQVTASYSDHTTAVVSNYTKSGYNSSPGEKTITITYSENGVTRAAAFSVTVLAKKPSSLCLTKMPSRTVYVEGQTNFDFSDLTATVTYDNGTTAQVNKYELFGISEEVGTHIVTVKYTENGCTVSAGFPMTVNTKKLETIYASALNDADNLKIINGGYLDKNRIQVIAAYDNGHIQVVTDYTISGLDSSVPGNQILTISHGGKQTNLSVEVLEPEKVDYVMTIPDICLPHQLTEIEEGSLQGCPARWIRLGEKVKRIENDAFADSPCLTQIYIPECTTYISSTAFSGLQQPLTIYGKDGSYAEYYAGKYGYEFVNVD